MAGSTSKFNRCVKKVRRTVKARKGSNKESAAIAICTKTILHPRGRTMKRYRRGRLTTQRKFRGGEDVVAAEAKAEGLQAGRNTAGLIFDQIEKFREGGCYNKKVTVTVPTDEQTKIELGQIIGALNALIRSENIGKTAAKLAYRPIQLLYGTKEKGTKKSTVIFLATLKESGSATYDDCELGGFAHRLADMYKLV